MDEDIAAGTVLFGRYRVDGLVGRGGFADVYAGLHLTLGIRIAIKVLRGLEAGPGAGGAAAEQRADLLESFLEEVRFVSRLRHPGIVRPLDQGLYASPGDAHPAPYVVLEWCGDETLKQWLARRARRRVPLPEALAITLAITEAMAHAHAHGVVHRDLKPSNVMLDTSAGVPSPRVIDFGIAKALEAGADGSGHTASRSAGKYTPAYAAPEQLAGLRTGPFTDVHAIALIFVELTTGEPPFDGDGLGAVDPERPTPARRGVDVGALEPVIARALSLRPRERYADAAELLAALRAASAPGREAPPRSGRERPPVVTEGASPAVAARLDTEAPISRTLRTNRGSDAPRPGGSGARAVAGGLGRRLGPPLAAALAVASSGAIALAIAPPAPGVA